LISLTTKRTKVSEIDDLKLRDLRVLRGESLLCPLFVKVFMLIFAGCRHSSKIPVRFLRTIRNYIVNFIPGANAADPIWLKDPMKQSPK
jgi:hypothetical protein